MEPFQSFKNGMATLPEEARDTVGGSIRQSAESSRALAKRRADGSLQSLTGDQSTPTRVAFGGTEFCRIEDAIPLAPEPPSLLSGISYASAATVN